MSGGFNPNAPTFSFQPGAGSFIPRTQQQQPGDQQQQQQPQGGYPSYGQYGQQQPYGQQPYGGYQAGYGGYQGGGGAYPQLAGGGYQGGYQGYQPQGGYQAPPSQGYQPPQVQARYASPSAASGGPSQAEQLAALPPKVLSLGGGGTAAGPPKPFVRKEATGPPAPAPSFSIGGPKTDKPKVISLGAKPTPTTAAPATAPKSASAAPTPPSSTAATAGTSAATTPSATRSNTPAATASPATSEIATPAAKKAEPSSTMNVYSRQAASTTADGVLAEAQKHLDEDVLKDLYGGKSEDTNAKEHMNLVFIGHVDAGKSTMGGQLLFLTGMVDKRTLEKFEKEAKEAGRESWYLSWALDSTPQERAKGKTVEVGRAYFETNKRRYTILDAPGHKTYVPSMISGAAQADVALLVISARKGEFEAGFDKGGQTREHAQLVKTAGVTRLIVVVNKMDDPTVNWEQERFDFIKSQLTAFLKKGIFNPKDVTFIPVSAFTGANMKEQVSKEVCPWNTSPSLLSFLDGMKAPDRNVNGPVMLPISEKYNDLGTIVVGKIESGRIYKGDTLLMMPNRTSVEITTIYDEVNEELEAAFSGDNVRIRLKGVTDEDVSPGYVLTSPQKPIKTTTQFQAQLAILESKSIICAGYSCVMHAHTAAEEVTLVKLLHYLEAKTGRKSKKPPQFAKTGQQIIALIETTQTVCLEKFTDYPQLGRFTLRDEGKTIAIGKVTKLISQRELADALPDVGSLALGESGAN